MKNFEYKKLIILSAIFTIAIFGFKGVSAAIPDELKQQIEEKNKSLQEIIEKISQTQKTLEETSAKGKTLNQEVKKIDSSINQLNLNIRYSEINITKTKLEIEELQYDINDTQKNINLKQEAVSQLLRELQKKDDETTLTIFLKNKSLSDSLNEATAIMDINSGLSTEIGKLQSLNDQLSSDLNKVSNKKQNLELENKNLKNKKSITENQKAERQTLLAQTKNQEKTYQQMLADLEKEQDAVSQEITDIEDKLRASFDPTLLPSKRTGVLGWPIALKSNGGVGIITSVFNQIRPGLDHGRPHKGLDIAAPLGTPVFAADDGKVMGVDNNDKNSWNKYQYGKYIVIEHSNNLGTLYAHLSKQVVQEGDTVKRGDLIGYVGNTGYSTGPHLHFGVYWAPSVTFKSIPPAKGVVPLGVQINPQDYL